MTYRLWYWPSLPGRGEFVRLAMEAAGIPYEDCARDRGVEALVADMKARAGAGDEPFAPPYLETPDGTIAQVATILLYLADRHDLVTPAGRVHAQQLQLTIADLVAEVHNVHHPVDMGAYYHEQKPEAARAAAQLREERLPKFLGYFERAAAHGDWLAGDRWSYADTSLFQVVEGLRYMFPCQMRAIEAEYPRVIALRDRVAGLCGIAAYCASERRIPFNEDGIFRHYPELDAA